MTLAHVAGWRDDSDAVPRIGWGARVGSASVPPAVATYRGWAGPALLLHHCPVPRHPAGITSCLALREIGDSERLLEWAVT